MDFPTIREAGSPRLEFQDGWGSRESLQTVLIWQGKRDSKVSGVVCVRESMLLDQVFTLLSPFVLNQLLKGLISSNRVTWGLRTFPFEFQGEGEQFSPKHFHKEHDSLYAFRIVATSPWVVYLILLHI